MVSKLFLQHPRRHHFAAFAQHLREQEGDPATLAEAADEVGAARLDAAQLVEIQARQAQRGAIGLETGVEQRAHAVDRLVPDYPAFGVTVTLATQSSQ